MKFGKVRHTGFVVQDIEKTISFYQDSFGATATPVTTNQDMGIKMALVELGETLLELFAPVASPPAGSRGHTLQQLINTRGEGITHLAVNVDDIEATLRELEQKGITPMDRVSRPSSYPGCSRIAYVNPQMELCQS